MPEFFKYASALIIALTLSFFVLSCGGGGAPVDPGTPDTKSPQISIQVPTSEGSFLTDETTITIGGISSDNVGVTNVAWAIEGGSSGNASGANNWSAAGVPVSMGDNKITVTATDKAGNKGTAKLTVTRNEFLLYLSEPKFSPSGFLTATPTEVTITVTIAPNPNLKADSVTLLLVDADNVIVEEIGQMFDDGDLAKGDEIKSDNLFSLKHTFTKNNPGEIRLRVRAVTTETTGDVEAFSAVATIKVVNEVPEHVANAAVATQEAGAAQYNAFKATDPATALQKTIDWLKTQTNVVNAEKMDSGDIWIDYTDGLTGMIFIDEDLILGGSGLQSQTFERENKSIPLDLQTVGTEIPSRNAAADGGDKIGSNKVLIYMPIHDQLVGWVNAGWDVLCGDEINTMLTASTCPKFDVTYLKNSAANVNAFNNLADYGMIVITTHGSYSATKGVSFQTGEPYSFFGPHMIDWLLGRLTTGTGTTAGSTVWVIRPGYISSRSGMMPKSVVYNGSCHSAQNNSMANAFTSKGAAAYFGYSEAVSATFNKTRAVDLFKKLVENQLKTSAAFVPGQLDPGHVHAEYKMIPSTADVGIQASLHNAGFEMGTLSGWTRDGDGRVIASLGFITPTEGTYMSIISTGLGFTTSSGSIMQTFCVPETATTLKLDWRYLSEEFMEYVGSQYQDFFKMSIIDSDSIVHTFFDETVDSIAAGYAPVSVSPGISFDQGGVYATNWVPLTYDISAFAGKSVTLVFAAGDVGDSIYDTAVLIDNIRVE